MELISIIIPITLLFVLLFIGLPIGFCLFLSGFIGASMINGVGASTSYLYNHLFNSIGKFLLTPIPLFVLMGDILAMSGIGSDMFDAALKWFGKLRGGLAVASIFACAVFAAMTGLSMAGAATIGIVAIPEMIKRGYDKGLATGSVCCAGTLGILIPPSLPFIMYGLVAEQSIGHLFIAGILPGILLTIMFISYVIYITWRNPELAPAITEPVSWKDRFGSMKRLWAAVVLIFLVLGSIYGGVTTPTEAAGVGALGALVLALANRRLDFKGMVHVGWRSVTVVGFIMFLVVGAMYFSQYLTMSGMTQAMGNWLASLAVSRWVIIFGIFVIFIILGMFLDSTAIILITTPIFLPLVRDLGFDPIWYGVFLIMNIEIAFVTPPVGMNLYVIQNIAPEIPLGTVLRGSMPFLFVAIAAIALVTAFPQIAAWLPSTMIGN